MIERLRSTYFYICWIPLAFYLASDIYIGTSTGWGQWAMGVVVMPPMLLSAAFLLAGLFILSDATKKSEPLLALALATALAGSVFIWFVGRTLLLNLQTTS